MKTATFKQAVHFLQKVIERNRSLEQIQVLFDRGLFSDLLECDPAKVDREEYRKVIGLPPLVPAPTITEYSDIEVDYTRSRDEMIVAGRYDWENPDIRKFWPGIKNDKRGKETIKPVTFHFDRKIGSELAIAEMEKHGYRPATDAELLAFGEKNPEDQRKFPIIALGSVSGVVGVRGVLCLVRDGSERDLSLVWFDADWIGACRFLAVRKPSGA